jgi:hypothetical protein
MKLNHARTAMTLALSAGLAALPCLDAAAHAGQDDVARFAFDAAWLRGLGEGAAVPGPFAVLGSPGLALVSTGTTGQGYRSWHFEDPSAPAARASFVEQDGFVTGSVRGADGVAWEVTPDGVGIVVLSRLGELPPCGGAVAPHAGLGHPVAPAGASMLATCDTATQIDVLVLYTPAVVAEAGSDASARGSIALAESDANTAYAASGITTRIRVVRTQLVQYDHADFGTDLTRVTNPTDGFIDIAHPLREAVHADMVALIRPAGEYCGIAYLMPDNSTGSEYLAFSVTARGCLSTQTFAHELGHNMGCCHAPGDGGGCTGGGLYPYSLGHRFTGASGTQWRTVMAYAPGSRLDRFSNPAVLYDGRATGLPAGDPNGERNNARTINETSLAIANYRCSGTAVTGDCNSNGTEDVMELAQGTGTDCDRNGLLDACQLAGVPACGGGTSAMLCLGGYATQAYAAQAAAYDYFGRSVATDGDTVVVGASGVDVGASNAGQVRLYRAQGEGWAPEGTFQSPAPQANETLGFAVAVDGDWAAAGAPGRNATGAGGGASGGTVRLYQRAANGTWTDAGALPTTGLLAGDRFGESLAMRRGVLAVGVRGRDATGTVDAGEVWVYERGASGWARTAVLAAPVRVASSSFGLSVATDGSTIVVGAPFEPASDGTLVGAAYAFARSANGQWSAPARVAPGTVGPASIGSAVAVLGDTLVVGAPYDQTAGADAGAAFVFQRSGGQWNAAATLRPQAPATRTRWGGAVAVLRDRVVVATRPGLNSSGLTWTFDRNAGYAPAPIALAGSALDGWRDVVAVGAPFDAGAATDGGAIRFVRYGSDCDGDGVSDRCEILAGAADVNRDGVPDACAPVGADLDGDGVVDGADLGALLAKWGPCAGCAADLDGDGRVDGVDLGILLAAW